MPGVETATQSADFWVKHDAEGSRFANYDAPALEITRGAETISIGENEGARAARRRRDRARARAGAHRARRPLRRGGALRPRRHPRLAAGGGRPRATGWRWRPTPTSTSCRPPSGGCATPAAAFDGLGAGEHYWRVSSLDRLGLPGVRCLELALPHRRRRHPALRRPRRAEGGRGRHHRRGGGQRRGRARRRGHGERRLRPGRRQRRLRHHAHPRRGRQQHRGRRRRPAGNRTVRTRSLHLAPGRRRRASPSTLRCRATPRAASSAPRASSPSPASPTPAPGPRSGWWRRTARWRCRRWWTRAAASTSPFPRPRPGRTTAWRSSAPTRRWPAPSR